MPIYEYKCTKCGKTFDFFARKVAEAAEKCPECGAPNPRKQFSTFSTGEGGVSSEGSSCVTGTCPTGTCPL
ncbi:MAG: zinc ribbon domain-containing protein [Candidatus Pacebacteria bacterium]|nr:zinc ribbon domain-containing protein [Candidatus Paceibacterota bacterium]